MSDSSLTLFDAEQFNTLTELLGDEFREILETFVSSSRADYEALCAAHAAEDLPQVRHYAHRIKGAAGNVGAARLAAAARSVEEAAKALGRRSTGR